MNNYTSILAHIPDKEMGLIIHVGETMKFQRRTKVGDMLSPEDAAQGQVLITPNTDVSNNRRPSIYSTSRAVCC